MYKILGFNKFKSKAGKVCCTLQLAREFNDREKVNGSIGLKMVKRNDGSEYFLPESLMDLAVPENIGKQCDIYFTDSGFIADIIIRK